MLELLLCSLLTILPDYLFRRYRQGKRLGKEITLFSVWFELRWGIVSCLMLTVALITTDFLLPSVDEQRDVLLQNRADHFGEGRARCRDLCRVSAPT